MLKALSDAVWGLPTVALIVGTGFAYTLRLRFPQVRRLGGILSSAKGAGSGDGLTPFQSLATSLAATVGTGSVTGVATALTLGGPGAVFWLWVSAFFGMAVAYAEGVLSIKYRAVGKDGRRQGGLWHALAQGLGMKRTAKVYAAFTLLASLGMGCMAQTNSAATALREGFNLQPIWCGIGAAIAVGICLFGNGTAGKLCERAVPALAGVYVAGALVVIAVNWRALPEVLNEIFNSAFGLRQAAGGAAGYTVAAAVSTGFRRGVFSNEAGLGTTAAVHGASSVDDPDRQGLMNMLEVLIDTFVICTLTALAVLCAGGIGEGKEGAEIIMSAAETVGGRLAECIVAACTAGFALATAVGWSQIGEAAAEYLFPGLEKGYRWVYTAASLVGSVLALGTVWQLSDLFNGLMVVPCLTGVIGLFGVVGRTEAEGE